MFIGEGVRTRQADDVPHEAIRLPGGELLLLELRVGDKAAPLLSKEDEERDSDVDEADE